MTQLLISVKNVQEALLALHAGADVIDLKDPDIGALGALDVETTAQIVQTIDGRVIVSATVGEDHASINALCQRIQARADSGVDIIKIAVSDIGYEDDFFGELRKLTSDGIKIVAVFFGDEKINFALLPSLRLAGFYGAMLDTKNKQKTLLACQLKENIHHFVAECSKNGLISGLAGSLKAQHIDCLMPFKPTFIGMRGGVCENNMRKSHLNSAKIQETKNMLLKHNILAGKRLNILRSTLHS